MKEIPTENVHFLRMGAFLVWLFSIGLILTGIRGIIDSSYSLSQWNNDFFSVPLSLRAEYAPYFQIWWYTWFVNVEVGVILFALSLIAMKRPERIIRNTDWLSNKLGLERTDTMKAEMGDGSGPVLHYIPSVSQSPAAPKAGPSGPDSKKAKLA
jgi:hypothetical protein